MNSYELIVAGMAFSLLIAFAVVLFYVRYRRQLTKQELEMSRAETNHQKELLYAVIQSQEEERTRIGMNLHDEVGSALSALRMLTERNGAASDQEWVVQCKSIIDRVITDVRNISHDLSPLRGGTYDFMDGLEDLCEAVNRSGKLEVHLEVEGEEGWKEMKESNGLALYRVLSELINNTIRHAEASLVTIRFSTTGRQLDILYRDNGKGLPDSINHKKGMGFHNIESRLNAIGAEFTIEKMSGGFGMQIRAVI